MSESRIAYFSMEIALHPAMPTYSGGLGMLAGDMLRAAADRELPMVAVTLLHRKGYFYQTLDGTGWQTEDSVEWVVEDFVRELPQRAAVTLEGTTIQLRAWQYDVRGVTGALVPVYLLDTDLPENSDWDRTLTHWLYGGDAHYRLCQEVVLGIGGVNMLRAVGHHGLQQFHMNEGHASLLPLALLDEQAARAGHSSATREDIEEVRRRCVFTTHTPVPAGHDQFPADLVDRVLGRTEIAATKDVLPWENHLNMTYLALNLSHYVNGVAQKHAEVLRQMFAQYRIDAITNGVHATTWTSPPFQALFDRHMPGWREENFTLRSALSIPLQDVWEAHDDRSPRDAASLYDKLERVVVPLFYRDRERFIDVMRHAIALNGSFFNTQRMVLQYVTKAYFR